ncbi:hypothetical protein DFH06DRAFT_1435565 [Mycena polygramma]|nr:hypothetical protein DFH06DRAFT_1435565 [Mycena polygramma]
MQGGRGGGSNATLAHPSVASTAFPPSRASPAAARSHNSSVFAPPQENREEPCMELPLRYDQYTRLSALLQAPHAARAPLSCLTSACTMPVAYTHALVAVVRELGTLGGLLPRSTHRWGHIVRLAQTLCMPCCDTPCRMFVARALATTRTPLQSACAAAYARVFGGRVGDTEFVPSPSIYSCGSPVRPFPRTARHRPRRASHHLHRSHKAARMMPGLECGGHAAAKLHAAGRDLRTLAVRNGAVLSFAARPAHAAGRHKVVHLRIRRSHSLSSDPAPAPAPAPAPNAPLARALPDAGCARPSPFAALTFSSTWPPRTPYLLSPSSYAPLATRTPIARKGDITRPRSAYGYGYDKLHFLASYAHPSLWDTLTIACPLFPFPASPSPLPACAAGWRRRRRRKKKDHRGNGHEG